MKNCTQIRHKIEFTERTSFLVPEFEPLSHSDLAAHVKICFVLLHGSARSGRVHDNGAHALDAFI
jgi:hypothetical protein